MAKATITDVMSVLPFVPLSLSLSLSLSLYVLMEELGYQWTDFHEI